MKTVAIIFLAAACTLWGKGGLGSEMSVRDLVGAGQARYQIVNRDVAAERTEIEIVLTDAMGRTIGGYAPPYLQSMEESRALWKDFVTGNLAIPARPEHITVREERKNEDASFAVAFVLDHSPSMTIPRAIRMQKAVQSALSSFHPNDYAMVMKFTGRLTTEVPLTRDKEEYLSKFKVNGLNLRSEGTAMYDAAIRAIEQLNEAESSTKKIMVLFTDGEDNSSSAALTEVLELARASNIMVHTVLYGVLSESPITQLSSETGGRHFRLSDVQEFDRVFIGIYAALRHSYVLSIETKNSRDADGAVGGVLTAAGSSSGSIHIEQMRALLPRQRVEFAASSYEDILAMNVDLRYNDMSHDVSPDDMSMLDSIATILVQRSDIGLDIVAASAAGAATPTEVDVAQRRVRSVRDFLIRRGVNPARIQAYANRAAASNPKLRTLPSNTKTTMVLTKL